MKKNLMMTLIALTLIISMSLIVSAQPEQRFPWKPRLNGSDPETLEKFERQIENYITFRIVLSSLNVILYGYILIMYIHLYNETKSKFSLGLVALTSVLVIYSLSSNPLLMGFLRGTEPVWYNVFNSIPDVFASVAAIIMIYLTRT